MIEADRPFRLRPRAPKRSDNNSRIWPAALRRVLRFVQATCKPRIRARGRTTAGIARTRARPFAQRCAVRITYSPNRTNGQWGAHARYVVRESAGERNGQPSRGFDAKSDHVDVVHTAAAWQSAGDPRMFKVILSPEFGERLDVMKLSRKLVQRMESDLRLQLEWVAVAHFNTEHPHTHVLLRAVAEGKEIRLPSEYVKTGIRKRAEDL